MSCSGSSCCQGRGRAQQCAAELAQAIHLQLLDRAVVHLGELLYEATQAGWAAREAQLTKRAVTGKC